ncbi:MAG TPA: translation initiation factor IF-2 [Candidatus Saccharimonadales bacterium]|nr:translation initiation factor IF-2 [Candidatus Saccharimonadales bacterium]
MASNITVEDNITVGDLAEKLSLPVTKLITELMKLGVMVTVNERIDFDTAQIIVGELGLDISLEKQSSEEKVVEAKPEHDKNAKTAPRPPVVAVMGHVDHGKTTLLDSIRGIESVKGEAGGITQHLAAYQEEHAGRLITFIDTPGHEAFAALREHGAQLVDLVIIVVAADDGVKPQTLEAIRFAKKSGVKIIVAINKIDKADADINRVKQQLTEAGLALEGWGGEIVAVEVSAKNKVGIDKLLDMVLLLADLEQLEGYVDVPATGLVIESHMETGRGPVAELLVEGGILKQGNFIVAGETYARIKSLETTDGKSVKEASPSTPVRVTGFKALPSFGERFSLSGNEKAARTKAVSESSSRQTGRGQSDINSSELLRLINRSNQISEFNIVVKADVQGSLVSVIDSLKSLNTDEVAIKTVSSGIGTINENDIHLAHGSGAVVYGFNVTVPRNIEQLARRYDTPVRLYKVIYELIDDVKEELNSLLQPIIVEKELGRLKVKGIFKITKAMTICGGEVTKGVIKISSFGRITRGKEQINGEVEITNLKRGPQDVTEVKEGEMCGLSLNSDSKLDLQLEDQIDVFTRETQTRTLY